MISARIATALIIILLCGAAGEQGWQVARFAVAEASVAAQPAQIEVIRPWAHVPGIESIARAESLVELTDIAAAPRRAQDLTELLAVRPISSAAWLELAGARKVAGQSESEILSALTMSFLTGPNEGWVMLERGLFGLPEWKFLRDAERQRAIADMAGAILGTAVESAALGHAKAVAGELSSEVRQDIAGRLRRQGVRQAQLTALGF